MISTPFIYIVDDDEGSRQSVAALVDPMDANVKQYDGAESFLADYHGQRPACLIVDQRMAGMSGIELVEKLRAEGHGLAIVMMTAFPETKTTVRAMKIGAVNLLEKPCSPQELWDSIQLGIREDSERVEIERLRQADLERVRSLTEKEISVMRMLAEGRTNKAVGIRLTVSLRTVEGRRASIFQKLGVQSIAEMMRFVPLLDELRDSRQDP